MDRDDWKYYDDEDLWDEEDLEREEEERREVQCPHCTRFVDAGSPYCTWCGRPLER